MNIQELQTIIHNKLPVKMFVWNNNGYLSIRTTQNKFFGRMIGTDDSNGVSFPDFSKIADAYSIKFISIKQVDELEEKIKEILSHNGPVISEVICNPNQEIVPIVTSRVMSDGKVISGSLDDMYPFLDREEYETNIVTPPPPPTGILGIDNKFYDKNSIWSLSLYATLNYKRYFQTGYLFESEIALEVA
jgi:acetolactate synthase-1/2/3 large subunit